ncbi:site-specific integrase [Nonomuraea sp. NPDC049758]|uniref:tyrosine-type recombinase/integrase n=1 Tax=Nonomuraea sp. NPDC049758 TaxID=3154360 RepID=UPI0034393E51
MHKALHRQLLSALCQSDPPRDPPVTELAYCVDRYRTERREDHDDDGLIFVGPDNGPLRNTNFNRRVWAKALKDADLPQIHFHDLRHTGNTLAASAGASIRELMARMGHSSTRAAMIYQHSTDERQREVARKLDELARGALDTSGTQRARPQNKAH